jgi:hypothetical protein
MRKTCPDQLPLDNHTPIQARMERSAIRGLISRAFGCIPDCASLHPGYEAAAVPAWVGPGSAKRYCAPQRVRDTKSHVVRVMLGGISRDESVLATRASTGHRDMVPPWIDAEPAVLHLETCRDEIRSERRQQPSALPFPASAGLSLMTNFSRALIQSWPRTISQ